MSALRYEDVSRMIDHSLLNPILTVAELESGCLLARRYDVGSVCIMPYQLARCAELLKGSAVAPQHNHWISPRRPHPQHQGRRGPAGDERWRG